MALLLSTTGTLDPVVINDLGARTFSHPTVNLNLELEYPLWQLVGSYDLSSALASGYITLTFDGSTFLTTTSLATISRGNMETFVYDPNASGIVNAASTSGAATLLNGFSGSYYLDRANQTGTQLSGTISDFNTAVSIVVMQTSGTAGYALNAGTAGWATNSANAYLLNGNNAAYYLNRADHTGTQTVSTISDLSTNGTSGWATNAGLLGSQNGAYYLNRTNHTGTQLSSTISDFTSAVLALDLGGTSGWAFNAANAYLFNSQLPSFYLNRTNHTGTQLSSTISDFSNAVLTLGPSSTSGWATNAANANLLNNNNAAYYLNRANQTGTQTVSTISDMAVNGTSAWATNAANADGLTTSTTPTNTNLLNWSTSGTASWQPIAVKSANVRNSYIISAGVSANSVTNRYCNWVDSAAMNLNGYVLPTNATIAYITASSNASNTWTPSVYINGSSVATLSITTATSGHSGLLNVNVNAGDVLALYVSGTAVRQPAISVHLYER